MSFEVSPLFLSVYQGFFETINPLVVAKSFQQRQQLQLLSTHLCQLLNFHFFILNFPHISHLPFFLTLSSLTFATRCRLHVVLPRVIDWCDVTTIQTPPQHAHNSHECARAPTESHEIQQQIEPWRQSSWGWTCYVTRSSFAYCSSRSFIMISYNMLTCVRVFVCDVNFFPLR